VKKHQVCIILGETGSGKSTQVAQYLYDSGFAETGVIVCTQPRKVAAFSLEKYVSEEMKGSGHVVKCLVGARAGKIKKDSKILFTTDYSFLMECIKDQDLKRFSCVIVDEAHERNINTDLLLGIIKKALPRRPDLRVIVTSATIDPELFIKYFGNCPVVRVSGKTFPVDVVWNTKQVSSSDYVLEAVEKVVEIHKTEGVGDVLVFLTCQAEIEQACTKIRNRIKTDDIICLPLHGKLQQEEQQKVFKPTPVGKRKIVFSTNCAETSLTIAGIKFVIDAGRAKEMKYDQKRNLNSLEVSIISQSSADQRKGRAGRTESGICFRLYTEEDFQAMEKSSKPEILRVNLGQALLKLMELGIRNPEDFDFVESPPIESIKTAVMELGDLGATCDGLLTELGKKMAKIPVDPGLSKFMFEGFEQGVGYEALVLIAVATVNGNVFFRMGTEDEKKAADMKKVEFCHLGGDFMTLLDVYRSWEKVDKRDTWCVEKSLNAKAMRMADETVKDLKSTLKHELKMQGIEWSSLDKETTDGRLQKTLFSCFLTKLCVYTGHDRRGYKTVTSGHYAKVHPSSSINFTGSNPQFIVYEKVLKTSQDFLLNVTPIEESWLRESIAEKKIALDIEEILAEVLVVVPPKRIRCSSILMKKAFEPFRDKLPELERKVSSDCNDAPIVIEAKRNSGQVDLFVPKNHTDKATEFVQSYLEEKRNKLRRETRECTVIAESHALRIVLEKGLIVQQILMPGMYRSVVVKKRPNDKWDSENVKRFLCDFGNIIDFNFGGNMYFATYEKAEEARTAVQHCPMFEEPRYIVEPKKPRKTSHQTRESSHLNFRVEITWHRRAPKGMANISFLGQPDEVWEELSAIRSLEIRSSQARVSKDKYNEQNLFISKLHCRTTKQDIKEVIEDIFPGLVLDERDIRVQYNQRQTPDDTKGQKIVLENLISEYATPESYEVTIKELDASNKNLFAVAKVDFLNPNEGINVARNLNGKTCHDLETWGVCLEVKPDLNFFDTCLKNVYELVKADVQYRIREIAKECAETCKKLLTLNVKSAKSKERIELSVDTKCLDHYLQASKEVSKCIQGEKIDCTRFLVGESGRDHLKEIQRQTGAVICPDERTMRITLYGTSEQKEEARDAVYGLVQDLILKDNTIWEVSLKEDGRPRGLLKEMMSKFGRGLQGILDIEGVSKVNICLFKQVLKIQSTSDSKDNVLRKIDEIAKTMAPTQPKDEGEDDDETCPTCFCEIDSAASYRLATCGHAYCMDCVKLQFKTALFPMSCTHENCSEMFTHQDMNDLRTEKDLLDNILKKSLDSYVNANQDKARFCPSPDCPMVYLVTNEGKLFRCNVCSTAVCSSCHEPYHIDLTCKENEIDKKDPGKVSLNKWMNEMPNSRKRCPNCTSPIEKNGGCNYMQCTHCNAQLCWLCMKVFPSGAGVYDHQRSCTGNRI
jgi:ATP-dependent RNA helicase DHX8/PRP22